MQRRQFLTLLPVALATAALLRSNSPAVQPESKKPPFAYGRFVTTDNFERAPDGTLGVVDHGQVWQTNEQLVLVSEGRVEEVLRVTPYTYTCATCLKPVDEKHVMHRLEISDRVLAQSLRESYDTSLASRVFSSLKLT